MTYHWMKNTSIKAPTPPERIAILLEHANDSNVKKLYPIQNELRLLNYLNEFHMMAWDLSYKTREDDISKVMARLRFRMEQKNE